ncbi:hypothetical protein ACFPIJ_33035 [Dactylosporangium cerinum]|uniref:Xylulose 5-phosphate/Fructose 6-phosphate phosphoketolase N-terminal domain-containing protein n=1 Tax=Dactylosporangium cerinum TaxID=1434730 RepID=A0ABV9W5P3_9ACTN
MVAAEPDNPRDRISGSRRFGSEITPLIPGVRYTGGQFGPALAVAQGMALDAPTRLVVPLIGDGECETGATAAAWLARRALIGTSVTFRPVRAATAPIAVTAAERSAP